jgi:hypothetical protein
LPARLDRLAAAPAEITDGPHCFAVRAMTVSVSEHDLEKWNPVSVGENVKTLAQIGPPRGEETR